MLMAVGMVVPVVAMVVGRMLSASACSAHSVLILVVHTFYFSLAAEASADSFVSCKKETKLENIAFWRRLAFYFTAVVTANTAWQGKRQPSQSKPCFLQKFFLKRTAPFVWDPGPRAMSVKQTSWE